MAEEFEVTAVIKRSLDNFKRPVWEVRVDGVTYGLKFDDAVRNGNYYEEFADRQDEFVMRSCMESLFYHIGVTRKVPKTDLDAMFEVFKELR